MDGVLGLLPNCLLSICCSFAGAESTARLQQSSRCWRRLVEGKTFQELWRQFLTESGELLASHETDQRRKYLQLASVELQGTWLDSGMDDVEARRLRQSGI